MSEPRNTLPFNVDPLVKAADALNRLNDPVVRARLSTRYIFPTRREPRTINNIDSDIADAEHEFNKELASIHRWHEARREQVLRELEKIDQHYNDMVADYNDKWNGYISELHAEREPQSFAAADSPQKSDEHYLHTPNTPFAAFDILGNIHNYTTEDHNREKRNDRSRAPTGITRGYADDSYDELYMPLHSGMYWFNTLSEETREIHRMNVLDEMEDIRTPDQGTSISVRGCFGESTDESHRMNDIHPVAMDLSEYAEYESFSYNDKSSQENPQTPTFVSRSGVLTNDMDIC